MRGSGSVEQKLQKYEMLLFAGALLMLAALLYTLLDILNPLYLTLILIALLLPLRGHKLVRHFMILVVCVFFLWFVEETRRILTPFVLSFALAYLFDPLVTRLERWRIPRWISVFTIVILVILGFVALLIIFIPQIIREINDLISRSVEYRNTIANWIETHGMALLSRLNMDSEKVQDYAIEVLPDRIQSFLQTLFKGAITISSAVSAAVGQILNLILVPFLFFYLLKDFSKIKRWVRRMMPLDTGWVFEDYIVRIDRIISGFFRGQLIVCLVVGILTTVGLLILGVNYPLLLGVLAGVLNIIPYIGLAITLVFGVVIGLFSPSPLWTVLKIVLVIEVIQIFEGSLLSPRIVGDRVGLHPAWVICAILIFSHFWGLFGLIIAVPFAATLKIFLSIGMQHYRKKVMG
jgi:predicted PurR-regulated permease PerM